MTGSVIFDPLLGWPLVWAALAVAVLFVAVAIWRGHWTYHRWNRCHRITC